jgi:hypothetical protein
MRKHGPEPSERLRWNGDAYREMDMRFYLEQAQRETMQ